MHRVIAPDQRGHGASFHPATGYGPEDYMSDLGALLAAYDSKEISVIGFSLGGRHALLLGAWFPGSVRKVVAVDMGVEKRSGPPAHVQDFFSRYPGPFASRDEAISLVTEEIQAGNRIPLPLGERDTLLIETASGVDWNFSWKGMIETLQAGRSREYFDDLTRIEAPTLLIRAERSPVIPPDVLERMRAGIRTCRIATIPGADHFIYRSEPEVFRRIVDEFLN